MDLLCNTYSTASDDDDEPEHGRPSPRNPSKRFKPDHPVSYPKPLPLLYPNLAIYPPTEAPIPGRYISKTEREPSWLRVLGFLTRTRSIPLLNPVESLRLRLGVDAKSTAFKVPSTERLSAKRVDPSKLETGGLSNRQKEHKKAIPLAAKRAKVARSRQEKKKKQQCSGKQFRGRKTWK
ncbi:hypothetical protein Acr_13g0014300 [Actinidia rufa]|uniref:SDA1 C-terminal domain-containing protein n=1 Tax=Actinidia rufa TaxID=165716 RepID=A0A7J0FN04_9ERIC|nr:hypothetical protein Acr_13g0014300 [Actinidia rufa]